MPNPATSSFIARVTLWSALSFSLNLVWEISHVGLYTIWREADGLRIAWSVFHCTVGDVLIALAIYALAAIALWRADWPVSRPWTGGLIVVIAAMAFTAWSEWYNVYRVGAWNYTTSMPLIFGIGLTPLLQWLVLPPAMVVAYRKLWPVLLGWQKLRNPIASNNLTRSKK